LDRRLLVLALGMFALGTDSFVVAGVLPEISRFFRVSISAAGRMTTVYAITYALLAPTIAALAAGIPRKSLLLAGLALFIIANLATAASPTFAIALVTRIFAGAGAAMFAPTATGAATMIVPADRRGFALSVVVAGLTASTALGSPSGALIGGLGDWRWTMAFVAALAAISALGVGTMLSDVPSPPKISLLKRIAPLADPRIGLTLATTLLTMTGIFIVYTYFAVVFAQLISGNPIVLGSLLVLWGAAGTAANLFAGHMIDTIGNRKLIVSMLAVLIVVSAILPFTGNQLWIAGLAIALWGCCGWGVLVPQQHRLVTIAAQIAPVVLGLNTSCTYLGVSAAGIIGAIGIETLGARWLGMIGAAFIAVALIVAEIASRKIAAARKADVFAAS
jgi:MFS transporter, DHA1 family, inner membrane transport protein